jgi:exodeoxyribonuclease VII large subunit
VARAIFKSNIPIISAVGHEIDFTIADFVADVRAPTPTAAGEIAVPNKKELISFINSLTDRLARGMQYQLEGLKHRLAISQTFRIFLEPERIIRDKRQQLDDFQIRLGEALKYRPEREKVSHLTSLLHIRSPRIQIAAYASVLGEKRQRLGIAVRVYIKNSNLNFKGLVGRLDSLSPLAVLGRGYAVCYHLPDRKVVTDVGNIKLDDQVEIRVDKGEMVCGVLEITHPQEEPTEKNK